LLRTILWSTANKATIAIFLFLAPPSADAQSVLDRATQGSQVSDEEIERGWDNRFERRIGQPDVIGERDLLAALRQALREVRPPEDRAERGYWHRIPPGGTKTIFVGVSDVSSVDCAVPADDRSICIAMVHSFMSIPASVRQMLGAAVFDWAAGIDQDGLVRWDTELELDLVFLDHRGWQINSNNPALLALEQPPVRASATGDLQEIPPGLECLGLGGWGVAVGC